MTLTHAGTASTVLLAATVMSAGYQAYRTAFGGYPSVDNFGVAAFTAYSVLIGVGIALRTDRRPVWWGPPS